MDKGTRFWLTRGQYRSLQKRPSSKTNSISEKYWKKRCSGVLERTSGDQKFHPLFPTPTQRDYKGARKPETLKAKGRNATNSLPDHVRQETSGQLNPTWVEWLMGFRKRVDRLRGLGNAIVPQIAALIMQMIKDDMNL